MAQKDTDEISIRSAISAVTFLSKKLNKSAKQLHIRQTRIFCFVSRVDGIVGCKCAICITNG